MKNQKVITSTLHCSVCNNKMVIPRKRGYLREEGHTKHMYCFKCKEETAFIESYHTDSKLSFWEQWQESHVNQES